MATSTNKWCLRCVSRYGDVGWRFCPMCAAPLQQHTPKRPEIEHVGGDDLKVGDVIWMGAWRYRIEGVRIADGQATVRARLDTGSPPLCTGLPADQRTIERSQRIADRYYGGHWERERRAAQPQGEE